MESLGDKLRLARESKGYSYEHVGRETNIARRYLEALEKEDFEKFPGEPYLLGFLRNYGDYLGLDAAELLSLYRAIKIQEQPVPVEQLLHSSSSFPRALTVLIVAVPILAFLAASVYFIFLRPRRRTAPPQVQIPMEYTLDGGNLERRFYRGDTVLVSLGGERFKLEFRDMADPLSIVIPKGDAELRLGGDTELDLNGDGFADVKATLADYDRSSPSSGALVRFTTNFETLPSGTELAPSGIQSAAAIFSSSTAYPFTLQIRFQGYCMFRYEIDRRQRSERYYSRNEEITISAQNGIRLWISNAAAVRIQVTGAGRTVPLEIGAAGEVVAADLRWLEDGSGRFRLSHYRLE